MTTLDSSQRKRLRSLAHHLEPIVMVGKGGITDNVIEAADVALEAHELIKVKFIEHKKEKKALAAEIEQRTRSALVGMIGHVAMFYRRQEDDEKRRIEV